ncbi:hypothetical protein HHL23_09230 [Chryseobacterium sp. RP-3-3]|uniref:Uncharacterized protein n=1 Tax=Chryseobacterium antibioticum TaxID=2728847 RepID=A0A7Y0AMD2_9FLAO|nr:hypothetical protein [Chryseobacterium antibioticum]NML69981.1 hypothetical protein [Chryseobacterium antibioticum]
MRFYIPNIEEPEGLYSGVKKFMSSQGFNVEEQRYRSISYTHNGKERRESVGIKNSSINEEVLIIFKAGAMFLVCTANRGVLRGVPILVGTHEILGFEYFEKE